MCKELYFKLSFLHEPVIKQDVLIFFIKKSLDNTRLVFILLYFRTEAANANKRGNCNYLPGVFFRLTV